MLILAHGALGPWDEIIFVGVAVIFLVMMVLSWVKSRASEPDIPDSTNPSQENDSAPDHYRLE